MSKKQLQNSESMADCTILDPELEAGIVEGSDSEKFDWSRKMVALALALRKDDINTGVSPESIAVQVDNTMFGKSIDYAVGSGEISEEEAVEKKTDRKAAHFIPQVAELCASGIEKGCATLGTAIGSCFGQPEIGQVVGRAVGRALRMPVRDAAKAGARKVYAWIKRGVSNVANAMVSWGKKLVAWLNE